METWLTGGRRKREKTGVHRGEGGERWRGEKGGRQQRRGSPAGTGVGGPGGAPELGAGRAGVRGEGED